MGVDGVVHTPRMLASTWREDEKEATDKEDDALLAGPGVDKAALDAATAAVLPFGSAEKDYEDLDQALRVMELCCKALLNLRNGVSGDVVGGAIGVREAVGDRDLRRGGRARHAHRGGQR